MCLCVCVCVCGGDGLSQDMGRDAGEWVGDCVSLRTGGAAAVGRCGAAAAVVEYLHDTYIHIHI